jgi:hypothetical protein
LQYIVGCNERDDILPERYECEMIEGDLKSVILGAGWAMLDSYFSMSRSAMTSMELKRTEDLFTVAQYSLLKMQCFKQVNIYVYRIVFQCASTLILMSVL